MRFLTANQAKWADNGDFYHNSYTAASRFSSQQLILFLYAMLSNSASESASLDRQKSSALSRYPGS